MNFIVIDDSSVDCFIAEKVIQRSGLSENCRTFQHAADALEHIKNEDVSPRSTIVFVDEHMPSMSGMDFVRSFAELNIKYKERYHIYLLSSSMDGKAPVGKKHEFIRKFIGKPLMIGTLHNLFTHDLKCVPNE